MATISLKGKVIITGLIETVTGLHIGGASGGLDIGGIDNPIIRHPVTREPYIPGSSMRGKLRSLLDRFLEREINHSISEKPLPVRIHECKKEDEYAECPICQIFGLTPGGGRRDWEKIKPTRLLVRDVALCRQEIEVEDESGETRKEPANKKLFDAKLDLPYTEVKWEAAIDRITSAAVPRQNERVPAGAIFGPFEFVYNLYDVYGEGAQKDVEWLRHVFRGMELLEGDYLGGYGSRGTGKIAFRNLKVILKSAAYYKGEADPEDLAGGCKTLSALSYDQIAEKINRQIGN